MFDVLLYLFETYVHSDMDLMVDQDELTEELTRAGFHLDEIFTALDWLERLAQLQAEAMDKIPQSSISAMRVYSEFEQERLDLESRGFLLFLEQIQMLTPESRELIIDRVIELDQCIGLEDLKWVILMVLFNMPGQEERYQQLEQLFFELGEATIH